ncbi:hypothetical protein IL992_07030 [Microbispora sp. NEAU-D428]|uniref:hypothetical protein n=1 Tax=Microbispora sitophila TaxID=2771537 RepID=UPI0018666360|nr:hypothetical protein [Microbispora sitophila]MBE3008942.1 hypothetical protein [Microbispora sitophila]
MSGGIFREEALRRRAAPVEQAVTPETGVRRFVILWGAVVVLVVVLSLLTWPLLGGGASATPTGTGVAVPAVRGGGR